ncbi:PII uridylyl-transferase [Roseivivax marinus]|uniref:Bifunctional uridylyltransferase/uridylyl-removing enzyme n=1 Tax=Roseivivax marinus TaxID=1379903 RepID=W4HIY2_9RHOB|nr:[protein-PII] uridylyltransferase [Roseivivax marinus]ETW11930.1 PII uridylyl-transferase [Roseivivax marinus]
MTQPQAASAAPASDPAPDTTPDRAQGGPADPSAPALIAPAAEIFDCETVTAELDAAIGEATDEPSVRRATVQVLSARRKAGREVIAAAARANPMAAPEITHAYSYLTDGLVRAALDVATGRLHRNPTPTESERLAVLAVGGYGRGEMAPHSDVDLLFLTPYKITAWAESTIESLLYILWDLKLKVGHASRTVKDCLRLGGEDFTIRTSMLEMRYLAGHAPLADELHERLWDDLFAGTEREFIEAKLEERAERHRKQGGQRYLVEPNVKEGKGGLRDLQSLFWITKYVYRTEDTAELVQLGVFRREEHETFRRAEAFLWAVRCQLHLIAGRAMEQLTFDMQVEVAAAMGFEDRAGRRGVEIFMQAYFRHATAVGDLTRIVLTSLEAQQRKEPPLLKRMFSRAPRVGAGYTTETGRLIFENATEFLSDKLNLLRIFRESEHTGVQIHPEALRLIKANLHLIDEDMRRNPEAQAIFLDLLLGDGSPSRALRRMNELGMLGTFIPEFEPIVAMMQFNMYHSYTVDEHTIQCIWHLSEIEEHHLVEDLPVATSILEEGVNRRILYVALLLHDIGKGRDEDHSVVGAKIARKVAPRLGLDEDECETIEWLVRHHLLMSDMAQKRDIADPRTVRDFAKAVKSRERLDLLLLLTVCDIRGVGPNTWNNWKAALLRALYRQTRRALESGMEDLNRANRGAEAKRLLAEQLSDWDDDALAAEIDRHYDPYWQGLHVTAHVVLANLLRDISNDEIRIDIHPDEDRDATRVAFALVDHPGIFSRLAGALALAGADVVDARTYTTKDGYATAAFWIQDGDGNPYEAERLPRLRDTIRKTLLGEVVAREAIKSKDKINKRERAFRVPTSITFDNDGSEIYTIIEVDTRDRPGLLYDLTRTLAAQNIYIASAVIATYGEQVVDSFYVKDMFGLKLHSKPRQKALERKLRDAIAAGVERAYS